MDRRTVAAVEQPRVRQAASFRTKLVALLVAAIVIAGATTMVAVLVTTQKTVRDTAEQDLLVARSVFDRLIEQRFLQLSDSVRVLASDFGFKGAATTGDAPTIVSALQNHSARAGADIAVLVGLDGKVLASTAPDMPADSEPGWRAFLRQLRRDDFLAETTSLGSKPFQLVAVPVLAPRKSAWLVMGFVIDDVIVADLKAITGLDVTFFGPSPDGRIIAASTLPDEQREALGLALGDSAPARGMALAELRVGDEDFLTLAQPLGTAADAPFVVLQQSLSAAFAPFERLELQLLALFALILTFVTAGGVRVARGLTAPIQTLMGAARRIGEGHYDLPVEVHSRDELGSLGETLNLMRQEISAREQRIVHQSSHDELTGLPNRYMAMDRIEQAIARANSMHTPFTVALLDLSRFKQINDTLGHHVGDQVLRELATRLQSRVRTGDTIARLGGDDFLIVLEGADIEHSVRRMTRELDEHLSRAVALDGMQVRLDIAVGLAGYPVHGDSATSLLRRAEIALYDAKDSPVDIVVYEPGRDEGHIRQLAIVADLRRALGNGEIAVHYQPQVDLASGRVDHAEALVRWTHPRFGVLRPDEFVAILEQSGNIGPLTTWMLDTVAGHVRRWQARGRQLCVSVNLSALDITGAPLAQTLRECMTRHGLHPTSLTLEVTESAVMADAARAAGCLAILRRGGHRIAIDDFGTGYSSLAQLCRLPVNELKIDKSFVMNLREDSQDATVVRAVIELAHGMGLEVVAEGVETDEGRRFLQRCGCERAQGYLFSKPLALDAFDAWLEAHDEGKPEGGGLRAVRS